MDSEGHQAHHINGGIVSIQQGNGQAGQAHRDTVHLWAEQGMSSRGDGMGKDRRLCL